MAKKKKQKLTKIKEWTTGDTLLTPQFEDIPYEEKEKELKRLTKKLGRLKI
jgi:hypothetical protein